MTLCKAAQATCSSICNVQLLEMLMCSEIAIAQNQGCVAKHPIPLSPCCWDNEMIFQGLQISKLMSYYQRHHFPLEFLTEKESADSPAILQL